MSAKDTISFSELNNELIPCANNMRLCACIYTTVTRKKLRHWLEIGTSEFYFLTFFFQSFNAVACCIMMGFTVNSCWQRKAPKV